MKIVETNLARVDAFQQHHRPIAIVVGVVKKYGDDTAGVLTTQLAYTAFVTVFPLLLLLVTILALVLQHHPAARSAVLNSTYAQFPVIGKQLVGNIHVVSKASAFGLIVGIIGLIYGSTGLAQAGLYAMEQVWDIPKSERPGFFPRLGRSVGFLFVLGGGLLITTVLSGFGTFGRHNVLLGILGEIVAVVVNVGLYLAAFRILTPKQVKSRSLVPGALFGGMIWTLLQALGSYIVGHDLRGATAVYGTFGLVLGLLAWIFLGAQVTLYAAEMNTVLAQHRWPRSLVQSNSTAEHEPSAPTRELSTR